MTHGGHREGAGRPPKHQMAGRRVDFYLPEYQIKWLKRDNNMSAKIQKIITSEMAAEIYDLVYTGDDKYHRASRVSEIQDWLDDGSLIGNETAEQLAQEWNEYDQEPEKDEIE